MINKITKTLALFGAFLGMFGNVNSDERSITKFDFITDKDLLREHKEGSIVLTLSNLFSKEVVKDDGKVKKLLKDNNIDFDECYCLNDSIFNEEFELEGENAHLQFLISLTDKNDDYLLSCMNKLCSLNKFDIVEPNYILTQCRPLVYEPSYYSKTYTENDLDKSYNDVLLELGILDVWNKYGVGSSNTRVGVIDGPLMDHVDLDIDRQLEKKFYPGTVDNKDEHALSMAGIIGANGKGNGSDRRKFSGVCQQCKIVPLVVTDNSDNTTSISYIIKAIDYAKSLWEDTSKRISVLNFSYSGYGQSDSILDAIKSFPGLFVWAAGNDGKNIDEDYYSKCPNLISVGAFDYDTNSCCTFDDNKASNYGYGINIYAPGDMYLHSTSAYNSHSNTCGTSAAAAFVSGTAALIFSAFPSITASMVKQAIVYSASHAYSCFSTLNIKLATSSANTSYQNIKNDIDPIKIDILDDSGFYTTEYLVTNLSNKSLKLVYKSTTCAESDAASRNKYDYSLKLDANSSKILTIGKHESNTCVSVMYLNGNETRATYSIKSSLEKTNVEGNSYRIYYESNKQKMESYVMSDSSVTPLTFTVEKSSGFIVKSWKIKITNNTSNYVRVRYNSKMCFKNDGLSWNVNNTEYLYLDSKSTSKTIDISGNLAATSIAMAIDYVDADYGFEKLLITCADNIKANQTPNYHNALIKI